MLKVRNLCRNFGGVVALSNISFDLDIGVSSVVGKNGAGKSTLLRVLAGADNGAVGEIFNNDVSLFDDPIKSRARSSYLSDKASLYLDLSPEEFLLYRGRLKGLSGARLRVRIRAVAEAFDIVSLLTKPISELSAGQRKRVALADTLLIKSKRLAYFMDEPYAGLDLEHQLALNEVLLEFGKNSVVMIASHNFEKMAKVSKWCLVLCKGELVANFECEQSSYASRVQEIIMRAEIEALAREVAK